MGNGVEQIRQKISRFKRRYYLNLFIKGLVLTAAIVLAYFLLAVALEYAFWLGSVGRFFILITFFGVVAYCLAKFLRGPISFWLMRKGMGDEQSAHMIGDQMPDVRDKLLNLIQLANTSTESVLVYASVEQKSKEFAPIQFENVIDLRENKRYFKYLAIPLGLLLTLMIINESILTQSTNRIVHFNQKFSPQAPFNFVVDSQSLLAFFNEDASVHVQLTGSAVPETAYLTVGSQRLKMETLGHGAFQYTFENLQEAKVFQIEAAGFYSDVYEITLVRRPELTQFAVRLEYPPYLNRKAETIVNGGNLEIPEGTIVNWSLHTANAQQAGVIFQSAGVLESMQNPDNQNFTFKKSFVAPDRYEIRLGNANSQNKEHIAYQIDVIKDQYPQIAVSNFKDSVLFKQVILGGSIQDDYGVTKLALEFHVKNEAGKIASSHTVNIPISSGQLQQSYFYNWSLDSLHLKPGDQLEYFLQVWDNDGVNGRKSTRSAVYTFFVPSKDQLVTDINRSQANTEDKIKEGAERAEDLQKKINDAYQKMKGKQTLDWQDKKKLEDILEQKKNLDQFINEMKDQNKLLEQKKNAYSEQSEKIQAKAEQIQKLMDELLDEETKKLLEELERLLNENADNTEMQNVLDKLNKNSQNLEKELDRTLELFKQLQFDYKLEQSIQEAQQQIEKQEELLKKTEALEKDLNKKDKAGKNGDNKDQKDNQSGKENQGDNHNPEANQLAEEQKKLNEEFQKSEEQLDELRKLGEELNKSDGLPEQQDLESVDQLQQQSEEDLQKGNPSKSKDAQQKAVQQMKKAKDQMESMQSSMSMEMDMQNIETLRQILHGLIKLSFDQEKLMDQFRELQANDPAFNPLAQQQIKLRDDVKVLEDSLLALGKRDPNMGNFITREVTELNNHLEKVIESNKERRRQQAATEMQYSMTAINNLALMLDSHFDMLMQMMANAKPSAGKGKKKGEQSLSQMQQQLNKKIEQLKQSGKSGRQLSEELAQMAAEQERIRRALQEMQEKMKQQGGKAPGNDLNEKMEQTETELVNKQLTDQIIQRQREIVTRLLEAEQSMREQKMDEERKGETAKEYEKEIPKAIEEYLRLKEKEVELLKTVPPKLYPFYKKEVSEYFKRIGEN